MDSGHQQASWDHPSAPPPLPEGAGWAGCPLEGALGGGEVEQQLPPGHRRDPRGPRDGGDGQGGNREGGASPECLRYKEGFAASAAELET